MDGTTAAAAGVVALSAPAQPGAVPRTTNHYHVPANDKTVHSGYFSKSLKPLVEVASGRAHAGAGFQHEEPHAITAPER